MSTIVIPMAGAGTRFASAGYKLPKYLIKKDNKTLLELSLSGLPLDSIDRVVFVALQEHVEEYDLVDKYLRNLMAPDKFILSTILSPTDGQAQTVLAAREHINPNSDLIIYNIDTVYRSSNQAALLGDVNRKHDGIIGVHLHGGNNWSFARVDSQGFVVETAEKRRISRYASTGFYHFTKASDFLSVADEHVSNNLRSSNEFYVAPLYNDMIRSGRKFVIDIVDQFVPLGTPQELAEAQLESL